MFQLGFPKYLKDDVAKVIGLTADKTWNNSRYDISEDFIHYWQNNRAVVFPYRIYSIDNSNEIEDILNERQKMILHCIYSRSSDGYVRQKHLRSLLQMDYEDWAIPYIVKICDEYVVEILEMTYGILKDQDTERIKFFCSENREEFCKSYSRMISYWNEFYRPNYYKFHHYIGRKLFRECFGYSKSMER
ncbi:hypothetical protein B0H99_103177 [Planomicrobium soli]|uniref:Uncharacterized protein n=1 Tax=Planomicrobium soli TaxID=1176648 RepID=A0A2P8H4C0_9BACL|nr:hypothetical protein [Planomicrobium soli]PSL41043.1 hypothetical protein B0H99_103177 [Planomicrobium soli]